jgi:chemotaxis protein MotB
VPSKRKASGEATCPLWMMTFGDCMSLLVTFFVMLISFTNTEEEKLLDMIGAFKGALGVGPASQIIKDVPHQRITGASQIPRWLSIDELSAVLPDARLTVRRFGHPQPGGVQVDVIVRMLEDGMAFIVSADPMFEPGQAIPIPGNEDLFAQVGGFLSSFSNEVRVVGVIPAETVVRDDHTRTPQGLGLARADVVQKRLVEHGRLDPARFGVGARLTNGESEDRGPTLPGARIEIILVGRDPARNVSPEAIIVKDEWR